MNTKRILWLAAVAISIATPAMAQHVLRSGSKTLSIGNRMAGASVSAVATSSAYVGGRNRHAWAAAHVRAVGKLFNRSRELGYMFGGVYTNSYGTNATNFTVRIAGNTVVRNSRRTGNTTDYERTRTWRRDLFSRDLFWGVSIAGASVGVRGNVGVEVTAGAALGRGSNYARLSYTGSANGSLRARASLIGYIQASGKIVDTRLSGTTRAYASSAPVVTGSLTLAIRAVAVRLKACLSVPFFRDPCITLISWSSRSRTYPNLLDL